MLTKRLDITLVASLAIIVFAFLVFQEPVVCSAEEDGGTIVFIKPVRAVIFEHSLHLEKKLSCADCHPAIFTKKAGQAENRDDFTMAAFEQGKYCGACHDGSTAFSSNTRCTWCHIGVREHKRMEGDSLDLENKNR
jgi:c(7)-type cytochrome triheme protein